MAERFDRRTLRLIALAGLTLLLAACAGDAELDTRTDLAGPEAREIEDFLRWVLWIAYAIGAVVTFVILAAWRRFRVKGEYEEGDWPAQTHGNNALEIGWTIAPAVLLAIIAIFTISVHASLNSDDANPIAIELAAGTIDWEPEVVVIGQQWWWEYQYHFGDVELDAQRLETLPRADLTTATQMVIPVGEEIELEITSRDVIHSHWIPSLNGKRDAVPGRQFSPWKIQADEPGVYFGQCTEFCGLSHSRMRMQVIALEMDEFQSWVSAQMEGVPLDGADQAYVDAVVAGDSPTATNSVQRGINTFRTKCASCHLMDGVADDLWSEDRVAEQLVAGAAPNLTHFATRTTFAGGIFNVWDPDTGDFNTNDVRAWLQNPAALKENYTDPVSDDDSRMRGMPNLGLSTQEIDDLVALLQIAGQKPSDFIIRESGVE
jgi:cytochrome c oxidase subunit 2